MTLYAGRMTATDPAPAANELRTALRKVILGLDEKSIGGWNFPEPSESFVTVCLTPADAVSLATWIESKLVPPPEKPGQGTFDFTTE